MFLALKLLLFLGVLCYFVSALVATGVQLNGGDGFFGTSVIVSGGNASPRMCPPSGLSMLQSHYSGALRRQQRSCRGGSHLSAAVLPDPYPVADLQSLRKVYGPRRNKFWGDLSNKQTRAFYHELLPVSLQFEADDLCSLTLEERARRASMARHAARLYARERCALPGRLTAVLYDGFRHFRKYGTWNSSGQTWDELWAKYEGQVRRECGPEASEDAIRDAVCRRILEKSCCTNKMFDRLAGMADTQARRQREEKEEALRAVNVLVRRKVTQAGRRVIRQPLAALGRSPVLGVHLAHALRRT
ncbi:hypothetical protein JKP88DRAFT_225623 [Tribonema minus]|uniref:Uncharacterized protein n=1 Tax=Tribonema minus TaxID=303371 RepID=A0A836C9L0_9STRA|nr:hypothetical protein JKP88DRAFT_225623 [Tribonema minus]